MGPGAPLPRAVRRVGLSHPALFERRARLAALLAVPLYRHEGRTPIRANKRSTLLCALVALGLQELPADDR